MGLPAKKDDKMKLSVEKSQMGKADTLRFNVLTLVVEENYDRAIESLNGFISGGSPYPNFEARLDRYVGHAVDLVNAIRAKRNFPGMNSLTMAKQQEVRDKFTEHFQELQTILKKIEKVQGDLRIEDVRSTVWVVQVFAYCVLAIAAAAFVEEIFGGLFKTTMIVVDETFIKITDWMFHMLGF